MNLSKEVLELIEEKHLSLIKCEPHPNDYKEGMKESLTNPSILSAANLVSVSEMFEFAEWCDENAVQMSRNAWIITMDETGVVYTTENLFLYKQQSK